MSSKNLEDTDGHVSFEDNKNIQQLSSQLITKPQRPAPKNLICPEPIHKHIADPTSELASGSTFHHVIHQSRRDLYGGDLKKGIPAGFQHILYDISNAIIETSNYGKIDPETGLVFNGESDIYSFLATYLEKRLLQRHSLNSAPIGYDYRDDEASPPRPSMLERVYMRTLDDSGFTDNAPRKAKTENDVPTISTNEDDANAERK